MTMFAVGNEQSGFCSGQTSLAMGLDPKENSSQLLADLHATEGPDL